MGFPTRKNLAMSDWLLALPVLAWLLFFPHEALAWGPAAHLAFSLDILGGAVGAAPAIIGLLRRHRRDFLYGSLAADTVLGKNLARKTAHCHNLSLTRELLSRAEHLGEPYEAFMLGYLGHLAADVIAHNHFVPSQLVAHYRSRGIGHLYWEARFDQKLLAADARSRDALSCIGALRFPQYDRFLAERLEATIFSHSVSTRLFHRSLDVQRRRPWQGAVSRIDQRSKLVLGTAEVARWRTAAVALAALAIDDPWHTDLLGLDPTGRAAIRDAVRHRDLLRRRLRRVGEESSSSFSSWSQRGLISTCPPPP